MKLFTSLAFASLFALSVTAMASANAQPKPDPYTPYYGNYVIAPGHMIGIDRFVNEGVGERVVLFSDYQSGVVRRLFPVSESEFVMGPGFAVASPAELKVRFVRDLEGRISGLSLLPIHGAESFAKKVLLTSEEVTITDGKVRLAGTLMLPATRGPHPAIILLHGSGPLTRDSFGPYPHFFTSLGLAVLIYDKRGTGASTGNWVDATPGGTPWNGAPLPQVPGSGPIERYPEELENDALAAFAFLRDRKDINPKEIGFWGSSEGGMLATQVAARNHDVAFAIDSSGFVGPLWETGLYQTGTTLRALGVAPDKVDKALAYAKLWLRVARTGEDYGLLLKERENIRRLGKPWMLWTGEHVPSLEQMRWDWGQESFDSLPALRRVACPLLGLWGERDPSLDARAAERNARAVLTESRNKDFTLKIVPKANHSMAEMPSGAQMAPGVFEMLRSWLTARVHGASPLGMS